MPLASSCHLKLDPLTDPVAGPGLGGAVGVAVAVAVAVAVGVVVAVAVGVGLALVGPEGCVQAIEPSSETVASADPRIFSMVFSPSWSALASRQVDARVGK